MKFVPLLLKPADVPPRLRLLKYADFTNEARWDREMDQVIERLGGKPLRVAPTSQALRPADEQSYYNVSAIRQVLLEAFAEKDLANLVYDFLRSTVKIPPSERGPDARKRFIVQQIIVEAESHKRMDELLDHIARLRPREYRRLATELETPSS